MSGKKTRRKILYPGEDSEKTGLSNDFQVTLTNFSGPFDLLLQLISKRKLDITEVALSQVTDEFIAKVKEMGRQWDLEEISSFLIVAATLLDLKTARLLPQGEVDDPEDLALLEAKDLLFARLLQYRAFKMIAAWLQESLAAETCRYPRPGGLEEQYQGIVPEVVLSLTPQKLAQLAAKAMSPKEVAQISLAHLHQPTVSVQEQANMVVARLRRDQTVNFRQLCSGCETLVTVVRFLALLELFRRRLVSFEQLTPLGELTIRWTGGQVSSVEIADEFTGAAGAAAESAEN